jgi:hypothetical protein
VGQRVVTKHQYPIKVGDRVVDDGSTFRIYTVTQVNGDWLWVVSGSIEGWVPARQVTTLLAGGRANRADNLGIDYQLVPYGGHFAVQLTRDPAPGSPASQIRYPDGRVTSLETGDRIIALDGQAIDSPEDVLNHAGVTTGQFIDVRTGWSGQFTVRLAAAVTAPSSNEAIRPPQALSLKELPKSSIPELLPLP